MNCKTKFKTTLLSGELKKREEINVYGRNLECKFYLFFIGIEAVMKNATQVSLAGIDTPFL